MITGGEITGDLCACGAPLPCELHIAIYDMHVAYSALRRLTMAERHEVLSCFCRWCHRYLPPGGPQHECAEARCVELKKEAPNVRR